MILSVANGSGIILKNGVSDKMKDYSNGVDLNNRGSSYKVSVDINNLIVKVTSVSSKIAIATNNQDPSKNIILESIGDFVELFGCIHISKTTDGLIWRLVKNSLTTATYNILKDNELHFAKKEVLKDIKNHLKSHNIVIGYDFLSSPATSEISYFYINKLCEWLSEFLSDKTINVIRKQWPIYFTKAFNEEWFKDENYNSLIVNLDYPTRNYLKMINEYEKYKNNKLKFSNQNIFEEDILLKDIYIDLYGLEKNYSKDIVNIRLSLLTWIYKGKSNICMVSGDPGSGKSTVMKMLAESLANDGERVIFIDLFRLNFSDKVPALTILEKHIKNLSWMKDYDLENDLPIVLILDGLDEIKVNVWDNAIELIGEIKNSIWNKRHKVIVSGRKKIINYCLQETEQFLQIEVLPLFIPENERNDYPKLKDKGLIERDLRIDHWAKLSEAFNFTYDLEEITHKEHLKDLSTSPLLLFLLAWTIKYSNESIQKIHHSVELYNNILECVYTRKYNRDKQNYNLYNLSDYRRMLSITGLCAWQNDSRSIYISKIEKYCEKVGFSFLFNQWIDYHKVNNPSQLLLLFFFREKTNNYNPNESEIEFIHKSFYEYLSALEILESIREINLLKDDQFYYKVFYVFSKSLIGVETTEFIEGLLEYDERFPFDEFDKEINSILPRIFNVEWPVTFSEETSGNRIAIKSYQELVQSINNVEENILRLGEMISNVRQRGNIKTDNLSHLECGDFKGINMMWKNLSYTNFSGSDFSKAVLSGCELNNCDMSNSEYHKCLLNSCSMNSSRLRECNFSSAHLEAASMSEADLTLSIFDSAILDGAYFCDSLLKDTQFCGASLVACNFDAAKLIETDFSDADMERADLNGVIIKDVKWNNCSLKDTKLHNVKISQFDLSNDEIIEMLSEADLTGADWDGVADDIKEMIVEY